MLIFIAFGVYVIMKKQIQITRSWRLTGENARYFGVGLVITPMLLSILSRQVLRHIVPASILYHPVGGRLIVYVILAAGLLALAFLLRDEKPQPSN